MQTLLLRSNTLRPPYHHHHRNFNRTTITPQPLQPALRISYNALFKPEVSGKFFADHGEFRSTRVEFRRRNLLFDQPISFQRTWQLHSTRRPVFAAGVVTSLILANVVVFLLWRIVDDEFMTQNFTIQLDNFNSGLYHTVITSGFSHQRVMHIVPNMIALYVYGKNIERLFGPEFLLMLYLVGAFIGSVTYLVHRAFLASLSKDKQLDKPDCSKIAALGASDAVMAIWMLDILLQKGVLPVLFFILAGIFRVQVDSHVARSAHLGGAAVGLIAWAWLRMRRL